MATSLHLIGMAGGIAIHLINSSGEPTPNGDSSTAATTCIMAIGSAASDLWVPQTPQARDLFVDDTWIARSYQPVTETIKILIVGSYATCTTVLSRLTQALGSSAMAIPAGLVFTPHGASNAMVAQVLSGSVQPEGFAQSPVGSGVDRMVATLTLTRSPFWAGSATTAEFTSASWTNAGTTALPTPASHLIPDGVPLNISWNRPGTTTDIAGMYLASVLNRYSGTGTPQAYSTSSTSLSGPFGFTADIVSFYMKYKRVKLRIMVVLTSMTSPSTTKIQCGIVPTGGPEGTRGAITTMIGATSGQIIDGGVFDPDWFRAPNDTTTIPVTINVYLASTDGTPIAGTISAVYLLPYFDFCTLTMPFSATFLTTSSHHYELNSITPHMVGTDTTLAWVPQQPRYIIAHNTGNRAVAVGLVRGSVPKAYSGSLLWYAWFGGSLGSRTFVPADTTTASAQAAQLHVTYRN